MVQNYTNHNMFFSPHLHLLSKFLTEMTILNQSGVKKKKDEPVKNLQISSTISLSLSFSL